MRSKSTGATSPPAISRSVASPDAETPSYWPVFISWTMSSESRPTLTVDLAAGRRLERRDPVVALDLLAAGAADDVARPRRQVSAPSPSPTASRGSAAARPAALPARSLVGAGRARRRPVAGDGVAPLLEQAPTTIAAVAAERHALL